MPLHPDLAAPAAPGRPPHLRALALGHGALCVRRHQEARDLLELARSHGATWIELEETALQVVAYAGFPTAIAGLELLAELRDGPPSVDVTPAARRADDGPAADDGSPAPPPAPRDHRAAGREVFEAVYAKNTSSVLAHLDDLLGGFSQLVLDAAYGRLLARDGLDLAQRELAAVSALAAMGLGRPLESHIRGAIHNGCGPQDVQDILQATRILADSRHQTVIDQALSRLHRRIFRS